MNEGKVRAKLTKYGFLAGEIDPATGQEKAPQFYGTFSFIDNDNANQALTWFGGFKPLQPGKQVSQRELTLKTINDLGYTGNNLAALAGGVASNLLNVEKEYEIDIEVQKDQMGAVKMKNGVPQFRIKWVNDPEKSGFKNEMSTQDAQVKIGGLNLDAEMLALKGNNVATPVNAGFPVQNQAPVNQQFTQTPPVQNVQQPVYQQPPVQNVQNVQQPVYQNHQSPVQQPGQNLTNQQMGFDANGNPPF